MTVDAGHDGTQRLDLRGLRCPLPALRTEKALREAAPGAQLDVLTDDPLAGLDIPYLCRTGGHALIAAEVCEGHRVFRIARGADAPA